MAYVGRYYQIGDRRTRKKYSKEVPEGMERIKGNFFPDYGTFDYCIHAYLF